MSVRASCLTSDDIAKIQATYGDDYDAMIEAAKTNTIPDDINPEDLLEWIFENVGASSFDPDDPALDYLWEDSEVQAMMLEYYDNNRSDTSQAALIADIQLYLEEGGVATDALNDAARIYTDYVNVYGEPTTGTSSSSSSSEEFQNMIALLEKINPGLYILAYVMFELGPIIEEAIGAINDKIVDVTETLNESIDTIGSATDFEDATSQAMANEAQYTAKNCEQVISSYVETEKTMIDLLQNTIQMASSTISKIDQGDSSIIQNMR